MMLKESIMYCSKCGELNENTNKFCSACGAVLIAAAASPPVTPASYTPISPAPPPKHRHPYKTEYVLSLIGSMIGTIAFLILFIVAIFKILSYYSFAYANGVYILVAALAVLASFILGYIGISSLKRGKGTGGIFLIIAGLLGIAAIIIAPTVGWITAFYFPLLLTGGIVALARRNSVERNNLTADQTQLTQ